MTHNIQLYECIPITVPHLFLFSTHIFDRRLTLSLGSQVIASEARIWTQVIYLRDDPRNQKRDEENEPEKGTEESSVC